MCLLYVYHRIHVYTVSEGSIEVFNTQPPNIRADNEFVTFSQVLDHECPI